MKGERGESGVATIQVGFHIQNGRSALDESAKIRTNTFSL